jgi:putative transposase
MPESEQTHPMASAPMSDEAWRTEVALFRYTLILPLLRHDPKRDGPKKYVRAAIAQARHSIPHSQRHTLSIASLRRWEKAYRQGGFEALKPRPRTDRGRSRAISSETLDRAEALKRELPSRSARTIIDILGHDQAGPISEVYLAPRTLRRLLAVRGATTARLHRSNPAFRRFERSHFGDLWQSDAMHGPCLPDPAEPATQRQTFLFAFIDDHTRLVPHAQFYWNEQLPRLEDCLQHAIARYGCPLAIYADQGHAKRTAPINLI